MQKNEQCYDDIIDLPHHVSAKHRPMPIADRASQFAPFAALTGHDAAVKEAARVTEKKIILDENCKAALDERMQFLKSHLEESPFVEITYFVPDLKKQGGRYVTTAGNVKKIDAFEKRIVLDDDTEIPVQDILSM